MLLECFGSGSTRKRYYAATAAAQPLAPCALALEGTVLGASEITWVGGRTVGSAAAALGVLQLGSAMGWGLRGVWAGAALGSCHVLHQALLLHPELAGCK